MAQGFMDKFKEMDTKAKESVNLGEKIKAKT